MVQLATLIIDIEINKVIAKCILKKWAKVNLKLTQRGYLQ